jgi:hypothetical protein
MTPSSTSRAWRAAAAQCQTPSYSPSNTPISRAKADESNRAFSRWPTRPPPAPLSLSLSLSVCFSVCVSLCTLRLWRLCAAAGRDGGRWCGRRRRSAAAAARPASSASHACTYCQHLHTSVMPSAHVSISQHTSAYVSIRHQTSRRRAHRLRCFARLCRLKQLPSC